MLQRQRLTVREISQALRISEKEVYGHLEHVQRSCGKTTRLISDPARCLHCGFVFRKRAKLSPPGKCPVCRSEAITMPLYGLESCDRDGRS
jgi:predicted Zn-ribbon and HTH transcriptional regulator